MLVRVAFACGEGLEASATHCRIALLLQLMLDPIDLQILMEVWISRFVQHQIIDHLLLVNGSLSLLENVELIFGAGGRLVEHSISQEFFSLMISN